MKLWIITVGEPLPTDQAGDRLLRSGMLAKQLLQRGHQVTWWASTFDHSSKKLRTSGPTVLRPADSFVIRLLHAAPYKKNVSVKRVTHHIALARAFSSEAALVEKPDAIWCSLPLTELCDRAVSFANGAGLPVVIDVRDVWPDAIHRVLSYPWRSLAAPWLMLMSRQANRALRGASSVVGVSDSYLKWGLRRANRQQSNFDRVFPIGYARPHLELERVQAARNSLSSKGVNFKKTMFWFIGVFGRTYDLATVIDAVQLIPEHLNNTIQFVFSGDGELGDQWRRRARELKNVVFTGWINEAEIDCIGRHAYCGLQAYASHAPQGLANKLYEYLSFGLPIVSSLSGENQDLLARHNVGITYRAGNAKSCADAIVAVLANSEWTMQARERASNLFRDNFDSSRIYGSAAYHLEKLVEHWRTTSAR